MKVGDIVRATYSMDRSYPFGYMKILAISGGCVRAQPLEEAAWPAKALDGKLLLVHFDMRKHHARIQDPLQIWYPLGGFVWLEVIPNAIILEELMGGDNAS